MLPLSATLPVFKLKTEPCNLFRFSFVIRSLRMCDLAFAASTLSQVQSFGHNLVVPSRTPIHGEMGGGKELPHLLVIGSSTTGH
jgi:hypothetical protein